MNKKILQWLHNVLDALFGVVHVKIEKVIVPSDLQSHTILNNPIIQMWVNNVKDNKYQSSYPTYKSRLDEAVDAMLQGDKFRLIGDLVSAFRWYSHSVTTKPTSTALVRRSYMWSMMGNFKNAIKDAKQAIELDEFDWVAHNNLGICCLKYGDFDGAIEHLGLASDLSEENSFSNTDISSIYCNMGQAWQMKGDLQQAYNNFAIAVKKDPSNQTALHSFTMLQAMFN